MLKEIGHGVLNTHHLLLRLAGIILLCIMSAYGGAGTRHWWEGRLDSVEKLSIGILLVTLAIFCGLNIFALSMAPKGSRSPNAIRVWAIFSVSLYLTAFILGIVVLSPNLK